MENVKTTIEFFYQNSGAISFGSLVSAGSIIFCWIKFHAKFIGDPLKKMAVEIDFITKESSKTAIVGENRAKELDQLLQIQDKRINSLEKEDQAVIATIQQNKQTIENLSNHFENHKEKFSELSSTLKELQNLDVQRQVAIGKVQTLLEVFVGKSK